MQKFARTKRITTYFRRRNNAIIQPASRLTANLSSILMGQLSTSFQLQLHIVCFSAGSTENSKGKRVGGWGGGVGVGAGETLATKRHVKTLVS